MIRSIALVLGILALATAAAHAQSATIFIDPENTQGAVGTMVSIDIKMTNLESISTVDVTVDYDPTVLTYLYSVPGEEFFGDLFLAIANGATIPGQYNLIASRGTGLYGDYTLITLTFLVIAEGSSPLRLGSYQEGVDRPIYVDTIVFGQYDFIIDNHGTFGTPLELPANLVQASAAAGSAEAEGFVDADGVVAMRADVVPGTLEVQLEVEVKPHAVAFDGLNTILATPVSGANTTVEVVTNALPEGHYRWRARLASGLLVSTWVEFDVDPAIPAFKVQIPVTPPPPPPPVVDPVAPPASSKSGCGNSATSGGSFLFALLAVLLYGNRRAIS